MDLYIFFIDSWELWLVDYHLFVSRELWGVRAYCVEAIFSEQESVHHWLGEAFVSWRFLDRVLLPSPKLGSGFVGGGRELLFCVSPIFWVVIGGGPCCSGGLYLFTSKLSLTPSEWPR